MCTTKIRRTARLAETFAKPLVKPLRLSTDTVAEHRKWFSCP
ncbi:MAG: hypothetical protein U1E06_07725 [Tabrizicola sp.]|nr:hypothetical protein [Tabrizicola sp.]